jgi:hypothetical protein
MNAMSYAILNKAWIDELTEKRSQTKLVGIADNEFTVANFMHALQISPYFIGVELDMIKKTELRKLDLRAFVINTKLDYAGKSRTQAPKAPGKISSRKRR